MIIIMFSENVVKFYMYVKIYFVLFDQNLIFLIKFYELTSVKHWISSLNGRKKLINLKESQWNSEKI